MKLVIGLSIAAVLGTVTYILVKEGIFARMKEAMTTKTEKEIIGTTKLPYTIEDISK